MKTSSTPQAPRLVGFFAVSSAAAVIALAVVAGASGQAPATGTISGRVVAAGSNEPLIGASVRLSRVASAGAQSSSTTVATGEKGEFTFTNLSVRVNLDAGRTVTQDLRMK